MKQRTYDSTVARIAGNLLSGDRFLFGVDDVQLARKAVAVARAIVAETQRTEPADPAKASGAS